MNIKRKVISAYRSYRVFKKSNRIYKAVRYSFTAILSAYALVLIFPQFMFAHEISHKNFHVYANQRAGESLITILDKADAKLLKSPIYSKDSKQDVFVAGSYRFHMFMTLNSDAFGSTIPVMGHIRINRSDFNNDLVFRDSASPNSRSLSGVIAHEVMHNRIREFLGLSKYLRLPRWKDEGYCEYVAGETTLSTGEGIKLWSEGHDGPGLDYFKYHQMVRYLLDVENVSVDDLFSRDFDTAKLEADTLNYLQSKN